MRLTLPPTLLPAPALEQAQELLVLELMPQVQWWLMSPPKHRPTSNPP